MQPKLLKVLPEVRLFPAHAHRATDLPADERRDAPFSARPVASCLSRQSRRLTEPRVREPQEVLITRAGEPAVRPQEAQDFREGVCISGSISVRRCTLAKKSCRS